MDESSEFMLADAMEDLEWDAHLALYDFNHPEPEERERKAAGARATRTQRREKAAREAMAAARERYSQDVARSRALRGPADTALEVAGGFEELDRQNAVLKYMEENGNRDPDGILPLPDVETFILEFAARARLHRWARRTHEADAAAAAAAAAPAPAPAAAPAPGAWRAPPYPSLEAELEADALDELKEEEQAQERAERKKAAARARAPAPRARRAAAAAAAGAGAIRDSTRGAVARAVAAADGLTYISPQDLQRNHDEWNAAQRARP